MDTLTLALALSYVKKQIEEAKKEGFKVQVEQNRSILDRQGEEKVFYFLPKSTVKPSDGYDEFVYANNKWEQVGVTDIDLSAYALKEDIGDLDNLPTTDKSSLVGAISETFTSVSNGKAVIASAITDKGVPTSSDATFSTMAQNIENIPTGGAQIVSGVVNANGTITFTDSEGNSFTTRGESVIGPQGEDYVLSAQDKTDIANIVLGELPTTEGVLYGNQSN